MSESTPNEAAKDPKDDKARSSRRGFLRGAAFGLAGLAAGGVIGAELSQAGTTQTERTNYGFIPLEPRSEPGFDHVVVVMFENRSFDHILGRLYSDTDIPPGQTFEDFCRTAANEAKAIAALAKRLESTTQKLRNADVIAFRPKGEAL